MIRLTIALEDDLYAMARAHAVARRMSMSRAVGDLLRRRGAVAGGGLMESEESSSYFDPVLGIRVSRCGGRLSATEVQGAIDDEDHRDGEAAGWIRPEGGGA